MMVSLVACLESMSLIVVADIASELHDFFFSCCVFHGQIMTTSVATFPRLSSLPTKPSLSPNIAHDVPGHCHVELGIPAVSVQLNLPFLS